MNKIAIIIPYFGKLPNLMPAFLDSCRLNDKIDFLFFIDDMGGVNADNFRCDKNLKFYDFTLEQVKSLIPEDIRNGLKIPYKLCDYKPVYGDIFKEFITEYDFWGYCDIDFLFGDLQGYLSQINMDHYDRLFDMGHLTIYRNSPEINSLYRYQFKGQLRTDTYKYVFSTVLSCNFDECGMNAICQEVLGNRWLRGSKLPYADIDWYHPYYKLHNDFDKPQFFVHYPDGKLKILTKQKDDMRVEEIYYIHMIRRQFLPIENVDFSHPYIISHRGLIQFEECKTEKYFEMFSNPSQSEMDERRTYFDTSLRKTRNQKFINEIKYVGFFRGLYNIAVKYLCGHL